LDARTTSKRVLYVDDQTLVRESLVLLLQQQSTDLMVVEAGTLGHARGLLGNSGRFDLVLLDLDLPDSQGLDTLTAIREAAPGVPVVVVSAHGDASTALRAVEQGAAGYITKSARSAELVAAVRNTIQGRVALPPALTQSAKDAHAALAQLSDRQREVLRLLIRGMSNKQIAAALDLGEATVKTHVQAVFTRLNVANRTQAVVAAARAQVVL
jgi:DNA-binding NarL/FixJ family response regulator